MSSYFSLQDIQIIKEQEFLKGANYGARHQKMIDDIESQRVIHENQTLKFKLSECERNKNRLNEDFDLIFNELQNARSDNTKQFIESRTYETRFLFAVGYGIIMTVVAISAAFIL
jgi:hypothetical protein